MNGFSKTCSIVAALLLAPASTALANSVDQSSMFDPSLYPAHVSALHIDGYTIDASNSMTWGNWSVGFGASPPVAKYDTQYSVSVQITGLSCSNSIEGTHDCGISCAKVGQSCALGPLSSSAPPTLVHWPSSIDLAP
jgi:hypothetical protein